MFSANFENNNTVEIGGKSDDNTSVEKVNNTASKEIVNTSINDSLEPIKENTSVKKGGMKLKSKKKDENAYY